MGCLLTFVFFRFEVVTDLLLAVVSLALSFPTLLLNSKPLSMSVYAFIHIQREKERGRG